MDVIIFPERFQDFVDFLLHAEPQISNKENTAAWKS